MCTRVFIGASLVMQSGDVLNRCGTAMVAAVASQFKVPVVCLCESYKFQPSFWLGSMTSNATVRTDDPLTRSPGTLVVSTSVFPDSEKAGGGVSTVGFVYDVTPARFIDLIVHKGGRMHPSAAINKVKENEKLKTMLPY
jgi:translation initiation factor eIF-2B subunit delta